MVTAASYFFCSIKPRHSRLAFTLPRWQPEPAEPMRMRTAASAAGRRSIGWGDGNRPSTTPGRRKRRCGSLSPGLGAVKTARSSAQAGGDPVTHLARAQRPAHVGGGVALAHRPAHRVFDAPGLALQPRCSSIRPAVRMAPMGLATSFPAHGGAEPCTGSKRRGGRGGCCPRRPCPARPGAPRRRSVTMSPNMLQVTITWNCAGRGPSAAPGRPRRGGWPRCPGTPRPPP